MTQAPLPIVDEVEKIIDAVMESERHAPKFVPMGPNPPLFDGMQPDPDGAWVSRVDVAKRLRAALVSPPTQAGGEPVAWDVQEFKIWKGIDPERLQWHGRGYCCSSWGDAAELMDFLTHNDQSLILRVAPFALYAAPTASKEACGDGVVTDALDPK